MVAATIAGAMPRKLKTYQTSLGFFDQAIAAPLMKAALEAWGADSNLFHQGVVKETDDPEVVAATMAKPGVVLRRPVGSAGPFKETAELPTDLARHDGRRPAKVRAKPKQQKHPPRKSDDKADRKAALAFERSRPGAIANVAKRRPRGRRRASGARRGLSRRGQRWTRPSGSTKRR